MSANLYVFAPIPRPTLWIFSSNPQPPAGYITLASAEMRRHRARPGRADLPLALPGTDGIARGDLERLIALYAVMEPEQRTHLVELARQLIESESPQEETTL